MIWFAIVLLVILVIVLVVYVAGMISEDWLPDPILCLHLRKFLETRTLEGSPEKFGWYRASEKDKYGALWEMDDMRLRYLRKKIWTAKTFPIQKGTWEAHVLYRDRLSSLQRMVEVVDTSTNVRYFLAVPIENRNTSTPKGAVAWTFGLTPENYNPVLET